MIINGLQKMTLLDFPGRVGCIVFLGGCNFRCPYCHNGNIVLHPESADRISEDELFTFLEKRKGLLDGVCITGGEPTLYKELFDFMKRIKDMGYEVKLDTNGYHPEVLMQLLSSGLPDYVAMDIKASPEKYNLVAGLKSVDVLKINESVELLKNCKIEYEFRTTVVKEFHKEEDFKVIGKWLAGAEKYYLQPYVETENVIEKGFHSYEEAELNRFTEILKDTIKIVEVRGI